MKQLLARAKAKI